jgi:DNA processing protein
MELPIDEELDAWLGLFCVPRLSLKLSHRLLKHYQTPAKVLMATAQQLRAFRVKEDAINAIVNYRQLHHISDVGQRVMEARRWQAEAADNHIIHWAHPSYPAALREIAQAPLLLFVAGDAVLLNKPQLAMVGSRAPSIDGLRMAEQFAAQLSQAGLLITSGLALGIDAASHAGALSVGLPTIAVMATGIDKVYPRRHEALAQQIRSNGVLVSEFPLGTAPRAAHFPQRNRIISGLSTAVFVIEAAVKSGSLITARLALEQNRDVFAMPGSIHNPVAKGCHQLIREGAKLVETTRQILDEVSPQLPEVLLVPATGLNVPLELNAEQQMVLEQMGFEAVAIDLLVERTGLSVTDLSAVLAELTLRGEVESAAGGFCRLFAGKVIARR